MSDFDISDLEGTWQQTYVNKYSDVYGCIQYQFMLDPANNYSDLPAVNLAAAWTAYNTWWNPLERGQYSQTYNLYADENGRLIERSRTDLQNTHSYIVATDYSSYFVEYACKQSGMDFWTEEYVSIFVKEGQTISDSTLDTIKSNLDSKMTNFDSSTLVAAKSDGECSYETVWGIF